MKETESLDEEPFTELEDLVTSGDKKRIDQFYTLAMKKFKDASVSENQIKNNDLCIRFSCSPTYRNVK